MVREPEIQKFWSEQQVYESMVQNNPGVSCVLVWVLWFGFGGQEGFVGTEGGGKGTQLGYQHKAAASVPAKVHRSKIETVSPQQDGDRVALLGFKLRSVLLKSVQRHLAINAAAHPPVAGVAHLHSPQAWTDQCLIAQGRLASRKQLTKARISAHAPNRTPAINAI